MSARATRRRATEQGTAANRHRHSNQTTQPSREELQHQVERRQREIENLRDQLAEREEQIADAEKQIAERSVLATAAATAESPLHACSPSLRLAGGNSGTSWVSLLTQYAATAIKLPRLLCFRGPYHLNCYVGKCSTSQTATHRAYENKELTCGILSGKVAIRTGHRRSWPVMPRLGTEVRIRQTEAS